MAKRDKVKHEKDIHYVIHGEVQRPWGFEVRVAIFDDDGNHVDSASITWPRNYGVPDDDERLRKVITKLVMHKHKRDNPEPEPVPEVFMEKADLEDFLVGRGYLIQGQSLEELPDLDAKEVEVPRWRTVWNYLISPAGAGY
jgi:hypothetical protein